MDLVDALKEEPWYRGQVVHVNQTGARKAIFLEPKVALQPVLKEVLNRSLLSGSSSSSASQSGVLKLYSHQAEAIDAILLERRDVIVSTSTGSGKSLIYMIAIFEALLKEEDATAILIFPTKALAQDQLRALTDVADALIQLGVPKEKLTFATLDGDTPQKERQKIRRETRVVLTNPDMLHSHVLLQHVEYAHLLHNARYVVLDEAHVYRGAFGAHVCSVMRRLRRLVEPKSLQFIACSATVANPGEHLQRLLGQEPQVVSKDGSPSGGHIYVMWDPFCGELKGCVVKGYRGIMQEMLTSAPQLAASPIVEVTRLLAWLVSRNVSCLAFCKWRSLVEIVLQDVKDALSQSEAPELSKRVVSYRGGYPPHLRRQLEQDIFRRKVLGVACTNALELGIDIGRLDCTLSFGFPGSVASLRQQFGRAGRNGRLGISFYVAFEDPTDQHFVRRPRELLARRPEAVAVWPSNAAVLQAQLPCAAAERPLEEADQRYWESLDDAGRDPWKTAVQKCLTNGTLELSQQQLVPGRQCNARPGGPHRAVSIRAVENHFEVLEEVEAGGGFEDGGFLSQPRHEGRTFRKLDEIEVSKAFYYLHPGAVYRYRGNEYFVLELDVVRRKATVKKSEVPLAYYTRAFDSTQVRILTREKEAMSGKAKIYCGEMELESRVKSFKRFWKSRDVPQEAEVEVSLPSWGYTSRGLWFEDPLGVARRPGLLAPKQQEEWTWGGGWAGAHAAMHALLRVVPLFVLADRQDLDAACVDEHGLPPMDHPRLMIFDAKDGGLGLCDAAFLHGFALLREARRLVEDCPCEDDRGCVNCIIDAHCREYNRLLSKRGALEWLRSLEFGEATGSTEEKATPNMEKLHALDCLACVP
ncbi:unnamed protein product [Durusdinium trenchii]|uniref:Uncharacterized protein n=1 Tax=Durusdinium trenchii TaxID=1381693 RepID=A0ABP0JD32_9DINO